MGGAKVSARNAGIPTDGVTMLLFVLSSTSAAFVGMCQAILYNSAQVAGGQSFVFNSIISVVVGHVLLTGGFGSVIGFSSARSPWQSSTRASTTPTSTETGRP